MSALGWTILAVCVIALAVASVVFVQRGGRNGGSTHALRRRFGPEYDRALEQSGDKRITKRRLTEIARRRDELDIRPLDAGQRADYSARWDELQTRFVDDPAWATRRADALIADVMRARGYPETGFDERAELISADRPEVVESYRQAHAATPGEAGGPGVDGQGTEELRSAFVHYRELFAWLVDGSQRPAAGTAPWHCPGTTSAPPDRPAWPPRLTAPPDRPA